MTENRPLTTQNGPFSASKSAFQERPRCQKRLSDVDLAAERIGTDAHIPNRRSWAPATRSSAGCSDLFHGHSSCGLECPERAAVRDPTLRPSSERL